MLLRTKGPHRGRADTRALLLSASAAALVVGASMPAEACAVASCLDNVRPVRTATIPANARGFFVDTRWWRTTDGPDTLEVARLEDSSGRQLPVEATALEPAGVYAVTWPATEAPSGSVTLSYEQTCSWATAPSSATVALGPAAPWPERLGAVDLSEVRELDWMQPTFRQADCGPFHRSRVAAISVRLDLAADAEPWQDALRFRLEVDGVPQDESRAHPRHPMQSFSQRYGPTNTFQHQVPCSRTPSTSRLAIVADAPGFGSVLRTPTVEVLMVCEGAVDAGLVDAAEGDAATDDAQGASNFGGVEDGCSCQDAPRAPHDGPAWQSSLLALLALFARRQSRLREQQ